MKDESDALILKKLQRQALFTMLVHLLFVGGAFFVLYNTWDGLLALRWLGLTLVVLAHLFRSLWRALPENRSQPEAALRTNLGLANHLTLLRGVWIAGLVGFLFSPRPSNWVVWAPAVLYTLACIADFMDGWVARVTRHTTQLGETLDLSFDGVGVLASALLAVQWGQTPGWYLSVALARYAFLAGLWWRQRHDQPVYPLPPSFARRALAGAQMGFTAGVLWPIFTPPGTYLAALLFTLPFLFNFGRDWLYASGVLRPSSLPDRELHGGQGLPVAIPLILRLVVLVAGGLVLLSRLNAVINPYASLPPAAVLLLSILEGGVLLAVCLGVLGRTASILGLGVVGLQATLNGLTPPLLLLLLAYTGVLFLGTGALSLWQPEEWLITHRAGEHES